MEVYARTGAEVINDEIEKAYLKTKNPEPLRIKFDHIITVEMIISEETEIISWVLKCQK